VSKQERKDEHLSDDNTGGHRRLCSCALVTQDGVEQLELARLYREEARRRPLRPKLEARARALWGVYATPAKIRLAAIRILPPSSPLAYSCASPLATAVRYRLEGRAQDTVEHDRTEIARTFCPVTP